MKDFTGKTAVITGAASGIGRAHICKQLGPEGLALFQVVAANRYIADHVITS